MVAQTNELPPEWAGEVSIAEANNNSKYEPRQQKQQHVMSLGMYTYADMLAIKQLFWQHKPYSLLFIK